MTTPLILADSPPAPDPRDGAPAAPADRFTLHGSPALERHLASTCARVGAAVGACIPPLKLEAILLGGGYGRGEGGVLQTPTGDQPYNDLEFYVLARGNVWMNEAQYGRALEALGAELAAEARLHVEFKLTSLAKLERGPVSMFSYDLVTGHRWVVGAEPLLASCAHHRDARRIPLAEATRLLLNRASGVLFAAERLRRAEFTPDDADFVGRNLAKLQLALGDALLTVAGQYHWSCQERHRRLRRLEPPGTAPGWWREVERGHAAGVAFKLFPCRTTLERDALQARLDALVTLSRQVWLWLEARRLDRPFPSVRDYVWSPGDKCPESEPFANRLRNLRGFGVRSLGDSRAARHPRERLFHSLSLLLWEPALLNDPWSRSRLQYELRSAATDFTGLVRAYKALWRRFN